MPEQFQNFLNILIQVFLTAALPVLVTWGVSSVIKSISTAKSIAGDTRWYALTSVARLVVQAAHQSGLSDLIENTGAAKKEWAIQMAQELLAQRGLASIDVSAIATAIESAYFEFKRELDAEAKGQQSGYLRAAPLSQTIQ